MKSFYEAYREQDASLMIQHNKSFNFPAHFHNNIEVLIVRHGQRRMRINGEEYVAGDHTVTVADSYDVHAYELDWNEDSYVVIIPFAQAQAFHMRHRAQRLSTRQVCDERLCEELIKIVEGYLLNETLSPRAKDAAIGLFLAVLEEKLSWTEEKGNDEKELIRKILTYVHENYRGDVSRKTLARALGYTEAHISRVFHRYMQTGLSAYVNGLRLAYVETRKKESAETTLDLIFEAGFKSWQTYYRVKKSPLS